MRAVVASRPGGPEVLDVVELPDPEPGPGDVVLDVAAAGLNRADVMQRRGFYPPPPGVTEVLGLECSGTVAAVGEEVAGWQVGDRACALLAGGGYATKALVPAGQLMPLPDAVDLVTAAAIPEVTATVWSNVFLAANLQPGEVFLVHGGSGGIGTCAIQLAHAVGARVLTTAGSAENRAACVELGAEVAVDYRNEDFVDVVHQVTEGHGADVILDNIGAKYLSRNLATLATGGRLVVIGLQGGTRAELDLALLLSKRAAVIATSLRARPVEEKATICASVVDHVWPLIGDGVVRTIVQATYSLDDVRSAHAAFDAGGHLGKILLTTE
ncbi:MAG: NAD(P)H-quinone oxidoreductase [Nocardioides sp.]|uniref:NAD(P)H-quinone oxidoreductase n=1 Tax=Nocardioides sp. TaxID=35761 RepID=UPI0039E6C770